MQSLSLSCFLSGAMLLIWFAVGGSALSCWNCKNAPSFAECAATGNMETCHKYQVCSTEVRKANNVISIWKGCKQRKACVYQRLQNWARTPYKCNSDRDQSQCWCCCDTDSCNSEETCEVTTFTCKTPSLELDHGEASCTNASNLGSLCSYRCTGDGYHGLPLTDSKRDRLCLGNGQWSEKKPCCVLSCPPYAPLDVAAVVQFNNAESHRNRVKSFGAAFTNIERSDEYYRHYRVLYHDKVYERLPTNSNGSGGSYQVPDNDVVNTGAALTYVFNVVVPQFHVGRKHSDVVFLGVERSSDDDVTGPAASLRNEGVDIYYIFFESAEHRINMTEARLVASSEDHIIRIRRRDKPDMSKLYTNALNVACDYPCPSADEE